RCGVRISNCDNRQAIGRAGMATRCNASPRWSKKSNISAAKMASYRPKPSDAARKGKPLATARTNSTTPPRSRPNGSVANNRTALWVEILVDKFFSYRPTERLLEQWRLSDLDLAAGTVADGLRRLEPLFTPVYNALLLRNGQGVYKQADETRWFVFVDQDGKS